MIKSHKKSTIVAAHIDSGLVLTLLSKRPHIGGFRYKPDVSVVVLQVELAPQDHVFIEYVISEEYYGTAEGD